MLAFTCMQHQHTMHASANWSASTLCRCLPYYCDPTHTPAPLTPSSLQISLSHVVMPMVKMVPRGFTAAADAYLTPHILRCCWRGGMGDTSVASGCRLRNTHLAQQLSNQCCLCTACGCKLWRYGLLVVDASVMLPQQLCTATYVRLHTVAPSPLNVCVCPCAVCCGAGMLLPSSQALMPGWTRCSCCSCRVMVGCHPSTPSADTKPYCQDPQVSGLTGGGGHTTGYDGDSSHAHPAAACLSWVETPSLSRCSHAAPSVLGTDQQPPAKYCLPVLRQQQLQPSERLCVSEGLSS